LALIFSASTAIAARAECGRKIHGRDHKGPMPTIHLMGGTIMGKNAGDSVTDSFG
jgi:hypothetical protein